MADPVFDPSKPFENVDEPKFDPSQSFENVPTRSVGADAAIEGGKGVARGAEDFLGSMGEAVMGPFGPSHHLGNLMHDLGLGEKPPETPSYGEQLAKATGTEASPETTSGKYTGAIGEVLGNPMTYFGPGGWIAKTLQGALSGAGGELGAEMTGDSPWGRMAGSLLAPTAGRMAAPEVGAAQARLMNKGVKMTPGQLFGPNAARAEEILGGTPLIGSMVRGARERAQQSFNTATANEVLRPIRRKVSGDLTGHDLVDAVESKLDSKYDKLKPQLHWTPDMDFAHAMARIDRDASLMPSGTYDQFRRIIDQVLGPNRGQMATSSFPPAPGGFRHVTGTGAVFPHPTQPPSFNWSSWGMQGQEFKAAESELSQLARDYGGSSTASERILGKRLGDVVTAVRENLERSNPKHAAELKKLNMAWAMYTRLRGAANKSTGMGEFTPAGLLGSIRKEDRTVGKGAFAKGDALMQRLGTDAYDVMGQKLGNSGTAERSALIGTAMAAPSIAKALSAHAGLIPALGLGLATYTRAGQNIANRLARPSQGIRGQFGRAGRGFGAVRPLLTTPYGESENPYSP